MWSLRATVVRAAGLAALALGFQALRWLTNRKSDEDTDEDSFLASPSTKGAEASELQIELTPLQCSPPVRPSGNSENPFFSPRAADRSVAADGDIEISDSESPSYQSSLAGHSEAGTCQDDGSSETETGTDASCSPSASSDSSSGSAVWQGRADGQAIIQTPIVQKAQQGEKPLFSPRFSFPEIDYEPEKSPFDLSSPKRRLGLLNGRGAGRHSRQPSQSHADNDSRAGLSDGSQAGSLDMAPAPTEEGDALSRVEDALAELEEQAVRRHSRSFSEPNLAVQPRVDGGVDAVPPAPTPETAAAAPVPSSDEESSPLALRNVVDGSIAPAGTAHHLSSRLAMPTKRSREESEAPPLLRLEILSGPSSGRDITTEDPSQQVTVGRNGDNVLSIPDNEVSGQHAALAWDSRTRCWQARDLGSLNGTRLNGNFINSMNRKPGKHVRLNTDDILLLGSRTAIKVVYLPNAEMPDVPQNLKRVFVPPSLLQPTITMRSEAMASLRAEVGIEKAFAVDSLRLGGAVLCHVGVEHQRKGTPCEDVPFWGEPGRFQAALYCIFDGHCGRKTASEATRLLPEELRKRMPAAKADLDAGRGLGRIWEDVFLEVDAALHTDDGSTATAVLVWKDASGSICIQTANVGDSAAVFCRAGRDPLTAARKLTADHRISDEGERRRLTGLGIELRDRTRLYGLNLSRCLGDQFIKEADLGIIAVPHVSGVTRLAPGEAGLLVAASDGLWDVADPKWVMQVASEAQHHPSSTPETIADAVYQYAMKHRSRDDVCVIVLDIGAGAADGNAPSAPPPS